MKKILQSVYKTITSDKATSFVKETIKETATNSIKTSGRYILYIILLTTLCIGGLIYLINHLLF